MLKNYLRVAIRSFSRNKTFSLINIIGLSIGISASLVIFLLVQYDLSFDRFEKEGARIYRVVADYKNQTETGHSNSLSEPMGAAPSGSLLLITTIILCVRTFKAAVVNPVESLRSK